MGGQVDLPAVAAQRLIVDGLALMTLVLEFGTLVPDVILENARDMRAQADEWGIPPYQVPA